MPRKIDLEGYRQVEIRTDGSWRCVVCKYPHVMIWERSDGGDTKVVCGKCYDGSGLCYYCQSRFTRAREGNKFRCEGCGGERKRPAPVNCWYPECKNVAKIRGKCMTHHKVHLNGCDICFTPGVTLRGIPRRYVINTLGDVRDVHPEASIKKATIYICTPCARRFFHRCDHRLCARVATEVDYKCVGHTQNKKRQVCCTCQTRPPARGRCKCHACHKKTLRMQKWCMSCQQLGKKKYKCPTCIKTEDRP